MLKATDEKPGTVWQRVSNSSTSDFFFQAITRNDVIFYESSAMKSEKVKTGKQFIDENREVSHDFTDVLLSTKGAGSQLSISPVIAIIPVLRFEISKFVPFSRHRPAVGLIWSSYSSQVCLCDASLSPSFTPLPPPL